MYTLYALPCCNKKSLLTFSVSWLSGVFLRWNRPSKFLDEAQEEVLNIINYNRELQAKVNALRRQLAELETTDRMQENL